MKLIVGLGNPGSEYKKSRHNVGFCLIDVLSQRWGIDLKRRKHQSRFGCGLRGSESIALMKPQTYMNLSGRSVVEAAAFYKIGPDELMVLTDDMALGQGQLRLRRSGSSGGHNGLQSIIDEIGHSDFSRMRVGIGASQAGKAVQHVLGDFDKAEEELLASTLDRAADAVECWLDRGIDAAMNQYNLFPANLADQTEKP